jgi:hypothetical protein
VARSSPKLQWTEIESRGSVCAINPPAAELLDELHTGATEKSLIRYSSSLGLAGWNRFVCVLWVALLQRRV